MPKQRLHILHLANSLSDRGNGIVNVAVDIALEQANRGHTVVFASKGGGFVPLLEAHGIQCIEAPQAGPFAAISNSFRLLQVIRRFRPHVVHTHMRSGLVLASPWTRLLRIPTVMHLHNVHDNSDGFTRMADLIIAVSGSVKQTLAREGAPEERIRVVQNGTIGSKRLPPVSTKAELHSPAIVTVAGMMHRKGIAELIEAFSQLAKECSSAHLYLVGGGREQTAFEELAARTPVAERIHFEGFQADPRPYLLGSDLFVLASRRESFGLAILEAREAGCAILASDIDGIPELLDYGLCGILSPPENPSELARNMGLLLANDRLRKELSVRARDRLERYTIARMTDEVLAVYDELL